MRRSAETCDTSLLRQAGLEHGLADGPLDDRLVQMMRAALPRRPVNVEARRREDPLPAHSRPVRVLPGERPRQLDPPLAVAEVALMERSHPLDMFRTLGPRRSAVLFPELRQFLHQSSLNSRIAIDH